MVYIRDQLVEEACTKCEGYGFKTVKDDEIECPKCNGVGKFLFYESVDESYGETETQHYPIKIGKSLPDSWSEKLQDRLTEAKDDE